MNPDVRKTEQFLPLIRLARSVARNEDRQSVWHCAEQVFAELIGHQLFTVLGYDERAGEVTRLYSNRPSQYPVSGTKAMGPTPWGEQVLQQGEPYIGYTAADIRWAFPDHELIASMGLESTFNIPVQFANQTLGTVNLLHEVNYYDESSLEIGLVLATLLAPTLMELRLTKREIGHP